ncbi:MAG: UDP-N-acetylmuramoyl-tripeptide--D-alanyl-D-alanine ligase [Spirochaetaceae bacterium]|nr:UDP-N-acetylmuramoyl-tripeptide--D-alanyl-D-alanine ligase [Spirochaetaceae bacterium]
MNYTVDEIAGMLGAGVRGCADARVYQVTSDSRLARAGSLFVALPGQHADGHEFVHDAFRRGATAALVRQDRHIEPEEHGTLIAVDDPLTALYDLARGHGEVHGAAVRIAVTGSSGKTTTKEILGSILRRASHSLVSEASFNAEIGLPMSVLRMTGDERFAVFEVGINSVGEMERYAALARPDHALVTNIGSAHVGRLGSRRDIAREKGALLRSVPATGCVYLREQEPAAELLLAGVGARVIKYGANSTIGYERSENLGLDGWSIHWEGLQFRFSLPGRHNLDNAFAALTVATELGCDPATVAAGIEAVRPAPGRLTVHRGRCTVIDDGYNANPESVRAALAMLGEERSPARRLVVLGPMLELGRYGARAHRGLLRPLIDAGIEVLCCFGAATRALRDAFAGEVGGDDATDRAIWTDTIEGMDGRLRAIVRDGDLVLLKASRAFRIERLLPALGVDATDPPGRCDG